MNIKMVNVFVLVVSVAGSVQSRMPQYAPHGVAAVVAAAAIANAVELGVRSVKDSKKRKVLAAENLSGRQSHRTIIKALRIAASVLAAAGVAAWGVKTIRGSGSTTPIVTPEPPKDPVVPTPVGARKRSRVPQKNLFIPRACGQFRTT